MRWWVKKQLLRLRLYAAENYQNEAESLIIWYAVAFAAGAAFYFALPWEVSVFVITGYFEAVLVLLYLARHTDKKFKLLSYAAVFMLGLCVAKADALYRAKGLEQNIPQISYIRGKVVTKDYNTRLRPRLLITNVDNYEKSLKGDFRISAAVLDENIIPGRCVEMVAAFPNKQSANPLSRYDFARAMFYKGISAVGYSIGPVYETPCDDEKSSFTTLVANAREYIKKNIADNLSSDTAAIIKALTIGDKSAISESLSHSYRTAGLAHFLAISGMHLGMIALLVFFFIRFVLAFLGEGRYDLRKPAAVVSIIFAFMYFLISGQSISCIRAFVMTSLVLLGVLLNRRAISLRLWAFAVLIVTIINPSAVTEPGFLMSFAAVLGLVSFYEKNAVRLHRWLKAQSPLGKCAAYMAGLLISDLVASLMTLPYSLYFFNQISVYTSLGNLLAGPIIAFWVMPALLLFLLSLPFGLSAYAAKPLGAGVNVINQITTFVTSLPGAEAGNGIRTMPEWGLLVLSLGLLWLCIWEAKWRFLGVWGIILGLTSLAFAPRADFVFDEKGETYACRSPSGKLTATPYRKNKFLEKMWTGENLKYKEEPQNEALQCQKDACICQGKIRFSKGKLMYNNQEIPLKNGGFISLNKGVYYTSQPKRIWHKN